MAAVDSQLQDLLRWTNICLGSLSDLRVIFPEVMLGGCSLNQAQANLCAQLAHVYFNTTSFEYTLCMLLKRII